MFDVLLRGGWVVDGSGASPYRADIATSGGRIARLGPLDGAAARTVLDVTDQYVLPGFIDAHVHGDALLAEPDTQLAALRQGVTTYVLGQDGLSFAPASAATARFVSRYFGAVDGPCPPALAGGRTVAGLLSAYDRASALNVAYLAPAGTIRYEVMGARDRPPDAGELAAMRRLVERSLDEGAVGLSTGLDYVPGRFADAAELAALCAPVAAAGRVYVTHMRGYEADAWKGVAEVRRIAESSGVASHISHYHGPAETLAGLVDDARGSGLDLTFDSYPYLRGSTILAMLALPADIQQGGVDATLTLLADTQVRARLAAEWFPSIEDRVGRLTLSYVPDPALSWAEGLPLGEAAARAGRSAPDFVCDLLVACDLVVGCVTTRPPTNSETDVRALLRHEAHMACSDGILLGGRPHPRAWGAFARLLARHTRELGDWSWGEAAAHLAGRAAARFGLADRGLLRERYAADVVVLDPPEVADMATYEKPRELAVGVSYVLVGGKIVLRDGQLTGATPGRALRRGERIT